MSHLVVSTRTVIADFAAAIDASLGYPKNGINVGGGRHASVAEGRTVRHANIIKHPSRNQWAYQEDPIVLAEEARVPVPGSAARETLDATWDGAAPGFRAGDPEI